MAWGQEYRNVRSADRLVHTTESNGNYQNGRNPIGRGLRQYHVGMNRPSPDASDFGQIVDQLIGRRFERSLAANSLKLRFGTEVGPKGTHYIWIDPPWELHGPDRIIARSSDESATAEGDQFHQWSALFDPLNANVLTAWQERKDGSTVFQFKSGHSLVLPESSKERGSEDWYSHWYATDRHQLKNESA